ncbi:hypothetical protein Pcinc_033964 [Petrolisthes cinctipes]|uniref:Cuticle protein n=1 Tax=Petrolisthes cinctipes TaxID=88211 RepID=A0AAE1ER51_PETCI|nr:hypothetical protein Pcinc_033964 [Petrolisthes cinctipes]
MKVLVLACLLGVAACAPQQQQQQQVFERPPQRLEEEIINPPQPYNFALAVSDDEFTNYQSRVESQDENGVVTGQFEYVAPNGIRYITSYTADSINGYQATTREEPTDIQIVFPKPVPLEQQAGYVQQ